MLDVRGDVVQYGDFVLSLVEPIRVYQLDFIQYDNEIMDVWYDVNNGTTIYTNRLQSENILKLQKYNYDELEGLI